MAEKNPKPEIDITKTYIYQSGLQKTLELNDKELERLIIRMSKLEKMTEQKLLSVLVKGFAKGAIKILVETNPTYKIDNGEDNTTTTTNTTTTSNDNKTEDKK